MTGSLCAALARVCASKHAGVCFDFEVKFSGLVRATALKALMDRCML